MNNGSITLEAIADLIQKSERILITSHIRPDGDSIGSLLGLGLTLLAAGKQVQMVSPDGAPGAYHFLEGVDQIRATPSGEFDAFIALDCSDLKRVGAVRNGIDGPDLNIDHHVTNENFAKINLVNPQAVATSEILPGLLQQLGYKIPQPAAAAFLTGLVTDTLGFRTSNMTARALRVAADLFEYGVDLPQIYEKTLLEHSFEAIEYWAAGLNHLQRNDGIIWTSLSLEDRKKAHYPGRDDADLITVLSSITGVDIAIVFVEQSHDRVKVSWRARPGFNVSKIALSFGGGGHPAASGAELSGTLAEVQTRVLEMTQIAYKDIIQENG